MVFIYHPLKQSTSEFNAKAQSRRDAENAGETSSSGEIPAAAPRPPGTAGPNCRSERRRSSQRLDPATCALGERRSRLSPSVDWDGTWTPAFEQEARGGSDALRAHRPGRIPGRHERWRSGRTGFSPGAGDREIGGFPQDHFRQPSQSMGRAFAPLRLCVFLRVRICVICVICGQSAIVAGLFAPLRWLG